MKKGKVYTCKFCGEGFPIPTALGTHHFSKHRERFEAARLAGVQRRSAEIRAARSMQGTQELTVYADERVSVVIKVVRR